MKHGTVRLVNGNVNSRGALEVCVDGRFATVCANSWDNMDATVVCREKGYSPYGKQLAWTSCTYLSLSIASPMPILYPE